MPLVMGAVVTGLMAMLPWVLGWFALGGNIQSVKQNIEGMGTAITAGPVKTATNAYFKVATFAVGLGFLIWLAESHIAESRGQELAAPPVESIGVPTPPTFGSTGGFTASSHGGVGMSSEVTTTGGGGGGGRTAGSPGTKRAPAPPGPPRPPAVASSAPTVRRGGF